ncbi:unnamed protein product [Ectocarpus sp. CCAP 1310/34]|nr:unnamed protein product [Ectocarpus sp. CCAP 1310/34]
MGSSCCCCCFPCLEPNDPVRAVTSRFLSQRSFLCYKVIATIYFVFWCYFWPFGEDIDDAHKFVTYWGWYMAAIYFLVSTATAYSFLGSPMASDGPVRGTHAVAPHRGNRNQPLSSNRRALLGFQVFSWNVACVGSLVIVTVFWVALFDNTPLTSTDVNAHILIAPVMAIDQLLVATKFERKQMLASFLFSIVYVAFNIVFFLTAPEDERVIYGQMDWGESVGNSAAFAAVVTFVLVPLGGLIHYCVFRLREYIYETCGGGSRPSSHSDIEEGGVVTAIFSR